MSWFSDIKDSVVQAVVPHEINPGNKLVKTAAIVGGAVVAAPYVTAAFAGGAADPLAGLVVDPITGDVTTAAVGSAVTADPLAGYVVDPITGDVTAAGSGASPGSSSWLSSVGKYGPGALNVLGRVLGSPAVANVAANRPNNVAGASGQRSDAHPLAGTWTAPGQPTYAYQPSGSTPLDLTGLLFPILAVLAGVVLLVLFVRR